MTHIFKNNAEIIRHFKLLQERAEAISNDRIGYYNKADRSSERIRAAVYADVVSFLEDTWIQMNEETQVAFQHM